MHLFFKICILNFQKEYWEYAIDLIILNLQYGARVYITYIK